MTSGPPSEGALKERLRRLREDFDSVPSESSPSLSDCSLLMRYEKLAGVPAAATWSSSRGDMEISSCGQTELLTEEEEVSALLQQVAWTARAEAGNSARETDSLLLASTFVPGTHYEQCGELLYEISLIEPVGGVLSVSETDDLISRFRQLNTIQRGSDIGPIADGDSGSALDDLLESSAVDDLIQQTQLEVSTEGSSAESSRLLKPRKRILIELSDSESVESEPDFATDSESD